MNLRYKMLMTGEDCVGYNINCPNVAFYRYWRDSLSRGVYKGHYLGLDFYPKKMQNNPSGIKANWGAYL